MNKENRKPKLDEYYQATAQRLYNYPRYLSMLNTAIINRDTALGKLGNVNHPISQYSERTAAASESMTGPENYAYAQELARVDIRKAERTILQLQNLIDPISSALSTLPKEETKVISLRFWGLESPSFIKVFDSDGIKGKKWDEFDQYGFSRITAIRICNRAQWSIRNIIFPCRQDEGTGIIAVE
jgi:hypothetical protein